MWSAQHPAIDLDPTFMLPSDHRLKTHTCNNYDIISAIHHLHHRLLHPIFLLKQHEIMAGIPSNLPQHRTLLKKLLTLPYHKFSPSPLPFTPTHFPEELISMSINENKISSNIAEVLRHQEHGPPLKDYLLHKHN